MEEKDSPKMQGRRRFLETLVKGSVAGAAGLAAMRPLQAFSQEMMEIRGPRMPDRPIRQISDHCYYFLADGPFPTAENQGFMGNIGVVITEKGVVIIDSGASVQIGEMVLRQLKKLTDKPVVAVFNTHYHGDHWMGNHAFVNAYPDVPIYAHPECTKAIKGTQGTFWKGLLNRSTDNAIAGTIITPPNKDAGHGDEFDFGDVTLRVHHYGTAHTPTDLTIEVVEDRVTYVGDVAMANRIANMDDGSYLGTFETMDKLEANTNTISWVPGHGAFGPDVLKRNRELFEGIYRSVEKYYDQGLMDYEMKDKILEDPRVAKYQQWYGFKSTIGRYISIAYLEVEKNIW